jgi:hypothetical protein
MIKGNEELYSHISLPIPLTIKKSYDDDKAKSHQKIEYFLFRDLRTFLFKTEEKFKIIEKINESSSEATIRVPDLM